MSGSFQESLGRILVAQGSIQEARDVFVSGLRLVVGTSPSLLAIYLEDIAQLHVEGGSYREALVLAAAAETLRVDPGVGIPKAYRESYSRSLAIAKSHLAPEDTEAALALGARMSVEEVIERATETRFGIAGEKADSILSPREASVARLLMVGLSDKEIAKDLNIAPRTVQAHIDHIKNKLGVHSRTQIAVWFVENRVRA